jgi:cystathionine beta-lyase/cystathionine gamma-synthase
MPDDDDTTPSGLIRPPEDLTGLGQGTRAIRVGRRRNLTALAPITWGSSAFFTDTAEDARNMAGSTDADRFYSRWGNPSVRDFEEAVAALEGAEAARAYASGMGAVAGVVLGLCSAGDHVVAQHQLYGQTHNLLTTTCARFGIDVTFVDGTEPGAFASAVRPGKTVLVFAETPANPGLDLVDLDELGAIKGPVTVVDSTFATPLLQRPLEHGVDLVLHSGTKGLAGHNDATLGVIAGSQELLSWLWQSAVLFGASASPYDAVNALRGLRTLSVRLKAQSASALQLATALEAHPAVASVRYPGLESHPQHSLAKRQMEGFGGLLCFDLAGGYEAGCAFVDGVRIAQLATSLGGPETLVTHPASTTHAGMLPDELAAAGITPGTIRVSVGLEDADDVVTDLTRALGA